MSDDLQRLEDWAAPLLRQLDARERRQLMRRIATDLRRRQQRRIRAQLDPDSRAWPPRKQPLRARAGAIKRSAMFTKLRTVKYLRLQSDSNTAAVAFLGRAGRIAAVHHYGLRDRVDRDGPTYHYPERRLLGFGVGDDEWLLDLLLEHLNT